jgi:peptide deformylase
MAIRKIFTSEDEILRKKCKPIDVFDNHLSELFDDMKNTLDDVGGLGLAAPQIGVLRRMCIIEYEDEYYELVNPEIIHYSDEQEIDNEGCLSVKGYRGIVKRPKSVTVRYKDRFGSDNTITATGYKARVFQHEIDHLDGILFIDKMIKKVTK